MDVTKEISQGTYNITLSGKFTFSDHPVFREIVQNIGDRIVQKVIIYMSKVEFVDSAALGMLLLARDEAEKYQKPITLCGASGQVRKMFDLARFNTLFAMN